MTFEKDPACVTDGSRKPRGPDRANRAKSRNLTAIQFEAVRPFLRISDDRIEAARLAMVEGQKLADIAAQFNWKSRQAVSAAVGLVWDAYKKLQESQKILAGEADADVQR
ncbi:TrfB-related DNA-binding protein [Cellvibrio sp. OA-2007]|uniref:TrfB-related DNA-binding protein n=1 Tax=Cellvibrio sp. OA-2007 TaxID=529823 RepID=UPI000783C676|nr:TrfB-related DNA-binding protein [Cellvibrio sp. OA-2007]